MNVIPADPIAHVLDKLHGVKATGDHWQARCPGHNDRTPSLTISRGDDGRVLLHCFTGCDLDTILAGAGLETRDLFPPTNGNGNGHGPRRIVATYDYTDEHGGPHIQVRRHPNGPDGKKVFSQWHADGAGGWIPGVKGLRRVVYRLHKLTGHSVVYAPEGEKDADRLWSLGLPATTNSGGAENWTEDHANQLAAVGIRQVVVPLDNDDAGERHGRDVARTCQAAGLAVKIVRLPNLPPKGDVSDWLDAGHTKDELLAIVDATAADTDTSGVRAATTHDTDPENARPVATWPDPPDPIVYRGVIGLHVQAVEPHTEADPVAMLAQELALFGNALGRSPHFRVGADVHHLKLYPVIVGPTGSGRKGTSRSEAIRLFTLADPEWARTQIVSGLSSGEGLIWSVRDPIEKQTPIKEHNRVVGYETVIEDHGVSDKRLVVIESEFASTLRVMQRDGSILSAVVRQAWDSGDLRVITKNTPARATGAHITIIGHVTQDEVLRELGRAEMANGFCNRFVWVCAKRSRCLPWGGALPETEMRAHAQHLAMALDAGRRVSELRPTVDARQRWEAEYPRLSAGKPGLMGAVLSRAEAQVMRLAYLYALSDGSPEMELIHLEAALALWRYVEASARFVFGERLGNPVADKILAALRDTPGGLTRTNLRDLFGRNESGDDITRALGDLAEYGYVRMVPESGKPGRPVERWYAS
jgi:hypothetical protein